MIEKQKKAEGEAFERLFSCPTPKIRCLLSVVLRRGILRGVPTGEYDFRE